MYTYRDRKRLKAEDVSLRLSPEPYRSCERQDYARLVHCHSFRRLQGKTQLYPTVESDYFRNRLTHSLEVAQIAHSIACKINYEYKLNINLDLVDFAGLAHDIGHPPFGHQGEIALDDCMTDHGGFESNAQNLRILTKIEKKTENMEYPAGIARNKRDMRIGLNLTFRNLASVLKYDSVIPTRNEDRSKEFQNKPMKGYYKSEESIVKKIKEHVLQQPKYAKMFKTVECRIMDIADDIAYSTYDLEDGLKAGFFTPFDIVFCDDKIVEKIARKASKSLNKTISESDVRNELYKIFKGIFEDFYKETKSIFNINRRTFFDFHMFFMEASYRGSNQIANNGFKRTKVTSNFIGKFIRGVRFKLNKYNPALSDVYFTESVKKQVELLKHFIYESQIESPRLRIAEYRGKEIIKEIFNTLTCEEDEGYRLLPADYQELYNSVSKNQKYRIVCDFIAGMTNSYAIEFYGRLKSENPATIFKPF